MRMREKTPEESLMIEAGYEVCPVRLFGQLIYG